MSIHEQGLDGDGNETGDGEAVAPDPEVKLGDLEALQGVVKFPVRIKCATLSWNTLAQALDEAEADRRDRPVTATTSAAGPTLTRRGR